MLEWDFMGPNRCEWVNISAVHQGLSKYLTAQDTHISPTSTNHRRTLSSHGNLLSLQSQSTIQKCRKRPTIDPLALVLNTIKNSQLTRTNENEREQTRTNKNEQERTRTNKNERERTRTNENERE